MKEYYIPINKMLANGLAPERTLKYGKYLDESENLIVRGGKLISPDYFTQPTVDSATWPLPQLLRHLGQTFVAGDDSLHLLNETTLVAGSALSIVKGQEDYTPTTSKNFSAGGPWTLVDLGPSFMLLNKNCTILKLPAFGNVYCCTNHINLYAGTNYQNRLWLGGFSNRTGQAVHFTASRWTTAFNEWLEYAKIQVGTGEAVDAAYVFYGAPDGGDIDRPYTAELALFGCPNATAFDALKTHIWSALRSGAMGFVRLVRGGTVYKLLQLGNALVAYSSRAVELISPRPDGAFEAMVLLDVGVPGPGAVTGDKLGHTFVSKAGTVYRIGADLSLQRLGFGEHLEDMASDDDADEKLVLSTEPRYGDVYISFDDEGYVLAEGKLSKVLDPPTSIVAVGNAVLATNTEEEELITNGTFASDVSWTKGTNWTISGGKANWTIKSGTLSQSPSIAVDTPYRLSYTVSNWAGGNTDAALYLSLGDLNGQVVEDDGDYEDIIVPRVVTDGLVVHPNILCAGSIDNISLNKMRRFKLTTGILQFNTTGRKTIKVVEVAGENLKGLQASVYWRNNQGDTWSQTAWRNMGPRGMVVLPTSGRELKVAVQGYFYDNEPDGSQRSMVDGVVGRYQLPDHSSIRGTYQAEET